MKRIDVLDNLLVKVTRTGDGLQNSHVNPSSKLSRVLGKIGFTNLLRDRVAKADWKIQTKIWSTDKRGYNVVIRSTLDEREIWIFLSTLSQFLVWIENIWSNGVQVQRKTTKVVTPFSGDFKVLYELLGLYRPSSAFTCPWCLEKKRFIDKYNSELHSIFKSGNYMIHLNDIRTRPEIMSLFH